MRFHVGGSCRRSSSSPFSIIIVIIIDHHRHRSSSSPRLSPMSSSSLFIRASHLLSFHDPAKDQIFLHPVFYFMSTTAVLVLIMYDKSGIIHYSVVFCFGHAIYGRYEELICCLCGGRDAFNCFFFNYFSGSDILKGPSHCFVDPCSVLRLFLWTSILRCDAHDVCRLRRGNC